MSGIFVSYRRASSSAVVYRLVDELKERFGDEAIFFDVESIAPGMSFAQSIQQALSKCTIALIVIGPQWVHVTDEGGKRRLENPDDWVRHEVSAALNSRARVIPVLVEGADIPSQSQLPPNIQELASLQAFTFAKSPEYWDFDIDRLEKRLRKVDKLLPDRNKPIEPDPIRPPPVTPGGFSKKVIWGFVVLVLFTLSLGSAAEDADAAYGFAFFFGLALVLHWLGFNDINKGLARGRGAAIGGMAVSAVLMLLSIFGAIALETQNGPQDFDSADTDQSFVDATPPVPVNNQDPQSNLPLMNDQQPADLQQIPQSQSPIPDDSRQQRAPDITGSWSSNIGSSYQFVNMDGTWFFYEFNMLQVQVGYGEGYYADDVFTFQYTNTLMALSVEVEIEAVPGNGNLLLGSFYNEITGQTVSFELYRMIAGF